MKKILSILLAMLMLTSLGISGYAEADDDLTTQLVLDRLTEGDERAHLVSAEMEPVMTFISKDTKFITSYMLKDVTEDIAAEHWLTKKGLTAQKLQDLYDDITGSEE